MKGTIGSKNLRLVWLATSWLLVLILLSFFPGAVDAQWTRLALDEGGVGVDVQLLRLSGDSLGDVVWSANMEGGVFRAEWDGDEWGSWTEYLPGRFMFGVEAIKVGTTEHVLAASGTLGVWYKQNPTAGGSWPRPNGYDYPAAWDTVWTMDAAFYCNTDGTWPQSPEDSFFVILNSPIGENFKPGIYRWLEPDNDFLRVDAEHNYDDPRGFANFWRDLEDGNVLYVTSSDGIYKLYGSYTSPKFEKLPSEIKFEDLPIACPPSDLPPLPARPNAAGVPARMMARAYR